MGKIVNINYKWPCSIAMSAMLNYQGVCVHVFSNCNFTAKAAIVSQTSGFVRLQEDEPYFCQFVLIHRLFQISSSFNIFRIQKIFFWIQKTIFPSSSCFSLHAASQRCSNAAKSRAVRTPLVLSDSIRSQWPAVHDYHMVYIHDIVLVYNYYTYIIYVILIYIQLVLTWWFGLVVWKSGNWWFCKLRKNKKYQTLQTMKSLKIKKTNLKQQWLLPD